MSILKRIENIATFFSSNLSILAILSGLIVIIFITADANYGLTGSWGGKIQKGLANSCGTAGFILTLIALAYYLLREAYIWTKKLGIPLPSSFDTAVKPIVNITRSIHAYTGFLAIYSVIIHGYVFVYWRSANTGILTIWSGVLALFALSLLSATGWLFRLNRQALSLKKHHKYIAFLYFGLYFIHKAIAD